MGGRGVGLVGWRRFVALAEEGPGAVIAAPPPQRQPGVNDHPDGDAGDEAARGEEAGVGRA
jgi:hypothetical protein